MLVLDCSNIYFFNLEEEIVVINESNSIQLDHEEIMNEIITLIHCFSMKHYSKRRIKRVIEVLNESDENED